MDSAKVSIGTVAQAEQYNDARADIMSAGYYPIDQMDSDDFYQITEAIVNGKKAAKFNPTLTGIGYFDVQIPPQIDTGVDWIIRIAFDMTTTDASKNVRLQLDYHAISDAGDTTPADITLNETVACPDTSETLKVMNLATLKIPNSALASGKQMMFKFSRLGADGADTHGGSMRIYAMQLIQIQP